MCWAKIAYTEHARHEMSLLRAAQAQKRCLPSGRRFNKQVPTSANPKLTVTIPQDPTQTRS